MTGGYSGAEGKINAKGNPGGTWRSTQPERNRLTGRAMRSSNAANASRPAVANAKYSEVVTLCPFLLDPAISGMIQRAGETSF